MKVIGCGVGRTGTDSLRNALNMLGLGPCHHMEEVIWNMQTQVPLWASALKGEADWEAIYRDYKSAVDWPTARFYRELMDVYPDAKFILTVRSAESWVASFSETIYKSLQARDKAPPEAQAWFDMAAQVIHQSGFPLGLDERELAKRFEAHNAAVKATIPKERLLVFQAKEGWAPLCAFLGCDTPDEEYPRTNNRQEFWKKIEAAG